MWSKNISYWRATVDERLVSDPKAQEAPVSGVKRIFQKLKSWLFRVFSRIVPDSDFYMFIFLSEMFCFVFLVFLPNSFSGLSDIDATVVREVFTTNSSIPTAYLLVLLHQFVLIVVDRAIYLRQVSGAVLWCGRFFRSILHIWLRQSSFAKLVLLYIQLVAYHVLLFFVLPLANGTSFLQSPTLIIFYL